MTNLLFQRTKRSYYSFRKQVTRFALVSTAICGGLMSAANLAQADIGATHTSLVSEFPSFNTPDVLDGRVEAIAIDGDTVYVGGTFTQVQNPLGGDIIDQPYLFAYSKSSGDVIRTFDPQLNNAVLALENTGDAEGGVFAGGVFGNLNGQTSRGRLAKIGIDGDRVSGFRARPNASVKTMVRLGNTLYIGGNFDSITSTPVEHLAAVDTVSGAIDQNLNFDFDGVLSTNRTMGVQGVDDIDITSDGSTMVIAGNFQSIDGLSRTRLAVLELDGQARVSDWNTDVFDVQCPARLFPQSIRGIDIAPDDSYFVVANFGFRIIGNPACDTTNRFDFNDLTDTNAQPTWTNYTGGDSVYEVVATDHAIYIGGHFRWLNNDLDPTGHNRGPGSTERAGMAALDPKNGLTLLDWRSDRAPRGLGTFALISEPEGLYIGDDTDTQNGTRAAKLTFLPITTNTIPRPEVPTLPTTVIRPDSDALNAGSFDGSSFGTVVELASNGWNDVRAGIAVGGQLFHADANGSMWRSQFGNGSLEPRTPVDLFGLTENEWALSQLTGMFFEHELGRVYYTLSGDSQLYYRAFTPAGPYFGNDVTVAPEQADIPWNDISGMDVVAGYLYFGRTNGNLYRAQIDAGAVVSGTTELVSGPAIDGQNWNQRLIAFATEGTTVLMDESADFEFSSLGSDSVNRFQRFEFPVVAGEPTVVLLEWEVESADVDLFIRDGDDNFVVSDRSDSGSPKVLTLPAGAGGIYTAAVQITSGATAYTLRINPATTPEQPEPLADFEFNSTGSTTSGRWQVFRFDVTAGETVDASVLWDNPNAILGLFLRDETGSRVARDNDGGTSIASVSAVAQSSGQWSVGIRVREGEVNYNVLIDTTP